MSPLTLAIAYVVLVCLWSFVHVLKHSKNPRKLPPGPRSLPIIGNLHLLSNQPHHKLHNMSKTYGPIMTMWIGNVPIIVVSSPATAELFLKTHDLVFASRPKTQAYEQMVYGSGMVFTHYGSYWRNVRKLCTTQLLCTSKIDSFSPIRKEELEFLVQSLKDSARAHELIDLSVKVGEVIENIIFKMILGCSKSKVDEIDLKRLTKEGFSLAGNFNIADYMPLLGLLDLKGFKRRMKKISEEVDKLLENIIAEHEKVTVREDQPKDFVHILLSLMNQPINPQEHEQPHLINRTNIKAIIVDMLAASIETSATVIEWSFSELLKHPRVTKKLQQELENVVGLNKMVEEANLAKLDYLDMVVKESLRLHPTGSTLLPREAREDVIVNGYFIPKKSRILVNSWTIGRDQDVWFENAEEFNPERFIGRGHVDFRGNDFRLLPFGSGRRGCPGIQLGLTTVRLVLAQLVHCFDWELPNGMNPNDLDMTETHGLTMTRANPLLVVPTYRLQPTC